MTGTPKFGNDTPLGSASLNDFLPTIVALKKAGWTAEDFAWLRAEQGENAEAIQDVIYERRYLEAKNPLAYDGFSVLERFWNIASREGWVFPIGTYTRLRNELIDSIARNEGLPQGADVFLSLRVRFGEGTAGVHETLMAHLRCLKRMVGDGFHMPENIEADYSEVHLTAGDETHVTTVEWIVVDASARDSGRRRDDTANCPKITEAAVADEGLVLAWLYPERFVTKEQCRDMVLGGYEVLGGHLYFSWDNRDRIRHLFAGNTHYYGYTVPEVRKP